VTCRPERDCRPGHPGRQSLSPSSAYWLGDGAAETGAVDGAAETTGVDGAAETTGVVGAPEGEVTGAKLGGVETTGTVGTAVFDGVQAAADTATAAVATAARAIRRNIWFTSDNGTRDGRIDARLGRSLGPVQRRSSCLAPGCRAAPHTLQSGFRGRPGVDVAQIARNT